MLRRRRKALGAVPLGEAVRAVAECPCARHHESLAASLGAADELLLRVIGGEPASVEAGQPTVGVGSSVQVATAIAPNGRSFLHAFVDHEAARARSPEGRFVGVAPQVAFRMAVADGNEGLLVTATEADEVIVTADGITRLLADEPAGT